MKYDAQKSVITKQYQPGELYTVQSSRMNRVLEYVEWHELQRRDAVDLILEFAEEISEWRGTCLDVGCGPAVVTREILVPALNERTKIVGMDISQKMIEYAKKTYANEAQLSFIEFNIEAKEIPLNLINAYDNATSFFCLHFCADHRKTFNNIYQMLRPGGKCLVMFIGYNDAFSSYMHMHNNPIYKPHMKDVMKFVPYSHSRDNRRAELKKVLESTGFEVLHCSERERTYVYKNMQILEKHLRSVNAFAERMPESIREDYETDFVRDVASQKISFSDSSDEAIEEPKILDRYSIMITYFRKPKTTI